MSCKDYQHQIVLVLYEELPEKDRLELEHHLALCPGCRHIFEEQTGFHGVLIEDAASFEVPADLLVDCRRSLGDQLDRMERKRSWWRLPAFSVVLTPMRLLESAALVAMGLALGVYLSNNQQAPVPVQTAQSEIITSIPQNGTVSNLRIVSTDPTTGEVELAGEVVQPLRLQGKMEDDLVRGLLVSALRDGTNPGSRLRAVEVLAQKSNAGSVKDVLIQALLTDENPGVRGKALDGLKPFSRENDVQTAFMQVLASDDDAGIRVQVIEALTPFAQVDSVARSVQQVTRDDDNAYVRLKSLQFVGNPTR